MTDTLITKTKYLNRSKLYRNQNNEIKEYPYVHKCTTKIIPKDTKDLKNNIRKSINQLTKKELLELSDHITKMMHKETFIHLVPKCCSANTLGDLTSPSETKALLRNQHSLQETSDSLGLRPSVGVPTRWGTTTSPLETVAHMDSLSIDNDPSTPYPRSS